METRRAAVEEAIKAEGRQVVGCPAQYKKAGVEKNDITRHINKFNEYGYIVMKNIYNYIFFQIHTYI